MKKNSMRSVLTTTLLAALLLASCQESKEPVEQTQAHTAADTDAPSIPAETCDLPEMSWDGRQFRVLGYEHSNYTQFSNFEIDSEGETGDLVNDQVFRRNTVIEQKYDVEIVQTLTQHDSWKFATQDHLRQTYAAQEDLYDAAFASIYAAGTVIREGMFYNLHNVDYIDFSKSWWNADVNDTLTIDGKLYLTTSDFSLRDKNRTYIMIYNKNMVENYNLDDPIALVREDGWTLDKMSELAKAVASDANSNGKIDDDDTFGVAFDSWNASTALWIAGDNTFIARGEDGSLALSADTERGFDTYSKILDMIRQDRVITSCERWNGLVSYDFWSVATTLFDREQCLFIPTFPHGLKNRAANCDFDYRIVPFPKYDSNQEKYLTQAEGHCMMFGILGSMPDPAFAGFMLEALSYESQSTTLPAYYEITCKVKGVYDEESAEMLDITFDGIVFDLARIYNINGMGDFIYNLASSKANTYSSSIATKVKGTEKHLEKLMENYLELP